MDKIEPILNSFEKKYGYNSLEFFSFNKKDMKLFLLKVDDNFIKELFLFSDHKQKKVPSVCSMKKKIIKSYEEYGKYLCMISEKVSMREYGPVHHDLRLADNVDSLQKSFDKTEPFLMKKVLFNFYEKYHPNHIKDSNRTRFYNKGRFIMNIDPIKYRDVFIKTTKQIGADYFSEFNKFDKLYYFYDNLKINGCLVSALRARRKKREKIKKSNTSTFFVMRRLIRKYNDKGYMFYLSNAQLSYCLPFV